LRWGPDFKDPPHIDAGAKNKSVFGYKNRAAAAKENQAE